MEVILREDYPQLGFIGERVQVKNGFARNYLIPRGIAIESGSRNAKELAHNLKLIEARRIKQRDEAAATGGKLASVKVEFTLKVGDLGKTYGSVTTRDIEAKLKEQGFQVERRQISLAEPIKAPGTYTVSVKLHSEVHQKVSIVVLGETAGKGRSEEKPSKKRAAAESEAEGEELEAAEFDETDEELAAAEAGEGDDDEEDSESDA